MKNYLTLIPESLAAMIAALDERDVDRIEQQTAKLAELLNDYRQSAAEPASIDTRDDIDRASQQALAASIRVNYLADWTRQRIDRLSQIRSGV